MTQINDNEDPVAFESPNFPAMGFSLYVYYTRFWRVGRGDYAPIKKFLEFV